jgi:hypothetical protein
MESRHSSNDSLKLQINDILGHRWWNQFGLIKLRFTMDTSVSSGLKRST